MSKETPCLHHRWLVQAGSDCKGKAWDVVRLRHNTRLFGREGITYIEVIFAAQFELSLVEQIRTFQAMKQTKKYGIEGNGKNRRLIIIRKNWSTSPTATTPYSIHSPLKGDDSWVCSAITTHFLALFLFSYLSNYVPLWNGPHIKLNANLFHHH